MEGLEEHCRRVPLPPTSRKRFVCCGALGDSDTTHFKRDFSDAELAPIHTAIHDGRVLNVIGPRQAGKTTLLHAVRAKYPNHVFATGERSLSTLRELGPAAASTDVWTIFNTAVWRAAQGRGSSSSSDSPPRYLKTQAEWRYPLSSCDWLAGAFSEPPLLVIDEFDMVGAAHPVALNTLLHGLRAMLPGTGGGAPAVMAVIVAGPPAILDIWTTDGGGQWSVAAVVTPRRFVVADLRILFDEWSAGEGVPPVDEVVLEGVLALTQGHRGWTMLLAGQLVTVKPLPAFTAAWWAKHDSDPADALLLRCLKATQIVKTAKDRLLAKGAASTLLAGTVLSVVGQRQAQGRAVERGEAVMADWASVLALLTDVGAVVYDSDVRRLLPGPAVYVSAVDDVLARLCSGSYDVRVARPLALHEMPTWALLASVVRAQQEVVSRAASESVPLQANASGILDDRRVPARSCYRSAMAFVLRAWLGHAAVVEKCTTGGVKGVDLRVETGYHKFTTEIVCHRPAGSSWTAQSVSEGLVRVMRAPVHPGLEPWLVNFVTREEDEVAGAAIRACMADPAVLACNRMHVVSAGASVEVIYWPAGSVAPADV